MKVTSFLPLVFAASVIVAGAQKQTDNQSPAAENRQICVVGNVSKPSLLQIEGSITLTEAINRAGGALPDSRSVGARVYRASPDGEEKELISINELRAVEKGRVKDLELRARDIVVVMPRNRKKLAPQSRINPCFSKPLGPIL
jgi:protein involved in polysaccharide export with SLBB domain